MAAWTEEPFNPHRLARLRPGTYQRTLVMRYLDTLLDWGDYLFTRDSIESINEATQLYVFAKQVLGARPELLEDAEKPEAKTFEDLQPYLDDFSNAVVAAENASFTARGLGRGSFRPGASLFGGFGQTTYFCVPFNTRLLSYWDTVEDRLFKIRNGMNIAGVVRSLPLFQPPIDPAMLVRAAAAGVDIGTVADGGPAVGNYRFNVLLGRAQALTGTVRGLGQALLSAIEKRDAEALALLRQSHEGALLAAVSDVRAQQLADAKAGLEALKLTKQTTQARHDYYDKLLDKGEIGSETEAERLTNISIDAAWVGVGISGLSLIASAIPNTSVGTLGVFAETGGATAANVYGAAGAAAAATAGIYGARAGRLTTSASYKRRTADWKNQRKLAAKELVQIEKQIQGGQIRVEIAKREIKNHELQIRHSAEVRDWMERKYTSKELYNWMVSQLSTLYFQSWQLAYAAAKKAEVGYQHELGRPADVFIQPVHWDSTRKGLLAGDRLQLDLERMDAAYLENDTRELELTKRISLRRLDPLALARFQATGECWFDVPEALFDLDCPGHYFRRIQSVAVTVACVGGPAAEVNVRLTLTESKRRDEPDTEEALQTDGATGTTAIVTSHGQEDTGLFQTDLKDPRYLPFERRGVISTWNLAFANTTIPQLDWSEVTDVILNLRYTARDGGSSFRSEVIAALPDSLDALAGGFTGVGTTPPETKTSTGLCLVLSAKRDFPEEWYAAQTSEAETPSFEINLSNNLLPYFATGRVESVRTIRVVAAGTASSGALYVPADAEESWLLEPAEWPPDSDSGLFHGIPFQVDPGPPEVEIPFEELSIWPESLKLNFSTTGFSALADVLILIEYSVSNEP